MIDIKKLRDEIDHTGKILLTRGYELNKELFLSLDDERKILQISVEELQSKRKKLSNDFGKIKSSGKDTSGLKIKIDTINKELKAKDELLQSVLTSLNDFLLDIPNLPNDNVPLGADESDNVVVKKCGEITSTNKIDHLEITNDIDTDLAAKLAGSRFSVLKGDIAKLQRALINFMLETAIKNGYQEFYVPYMANSESLKGTGQLPKFEEDLFKLTESSDLYLAPTAEVPVTNLHRDEKLTSEKLPIKYVCHSPCFRSEAGSYGKDTKGLIRQHQFDKVELVKICHPDNSEDEHEKLIEDASKILELLELPFRKVILSSGDTGFSASKTVDLEVWFPSQNTYREISSCSNFTDFQSRRANLKFKADKGNEYCHTLNGSGLAIGRTLAAILENYQTEDENFIYPEVLKKYI